MNDDKAKVTDYIINVPIKIKIEPDGKGFKATSDKRKCSSFAWTHQIAIQHLIRDIQNNV